MITLGLNSGLDVERRDREMRQRYRNVFTSTEGRVVLGDILAENHFGVPINSEAERIEHNVAIVIARKSGIMTDIDKFLSIGE